MVDYGWVTLTTDFGLSDGFVASCHGVIARLAPTVRVIDVTHQIRAHDIAHGAAVLAQTVPYLPTAVHVAVVDPGVGTDRRGIVVQAEQGILIGPDNGLLCWAADALGGVVSAVELSNQDWFLPGTSDTFHGRDIFAPVAARLAAGAGLTRAGRLIDLASLVRLPDPVVVVGDGWLEAEVLTVDRFGNVQLAATGSLLDGMGDTLRVNQMRAVRATTFGAVSSATMIVYVDSTGKVAVAVNRGRAAVVLSVSPGDVLRIAESG